MSSKFKGIGKVLFGFVLLVMMLATLMFIYSVPLKFMEQDFLEKVEVFDKAEKEYRADIYSYNATLADIGRTGEVTDEQVTELVRVIDVIEDNELEVLKRDEYGFDAFANLVKQRDDITGDDRITQIIQDSSRTDILLAKKHEESYAVDTGEFWDIVMMLTITFVALLGILMAVVFVGVFIDDEDEVVGSGVGVDVDER